MKTLLRVVVIFVSLVLSNQVYSITLKEYLETKGYSESDVSAIIAGGQKVKDKIDMRYQLSMLGFSSEEIKIKMEKYESQTTLRPVAVATVTNDTTVETKVVSNYKEKEFQSIIKKASATHSTKKYPIHAALLKAIIKAESSFNPKAISTKGAQGMMQLMPKTASYLKVKNSFDPHDNIMGGAKYVKILMVQFHGDLDLVLAAYVSGPEKVKKAGWRVPNIKVVKQYVKDVKKYYKVYA